MPGNVLTPNGDGLDDCFSLAGLPEGSCLDPFSEIKIYNRWGKPVFSNTRNNFCWDGAGMPAGVYYYTLHFGISSAGGSISLIR
ncbi:MAG: gliding motility-associated C-terminal domain-containing protein [Bacteroidota bacterium]